MRDKTLFKRVSLLLLCTICASLARLQVASAASSVHTALSADAAKPWMDASLPVLKRVELLMDAMTLTECVAAG